MPRFRRHRAEMRTAKHHSLQNKKRRPHYYQSNKCQKNPEWARTRSKIINTDRDNSRLSPPLSVVEAYFLKTKNLSPKKFPNKDTAVAITLAIFSTSGGLKLLNKSEKVVMKNTMLVFTAVQIIFMPTNIAASEIRGFPSDLKVQYLFQR